MISDTSTLEIKDKNNDKNIFILYHYPCSDGFGGRYAAWKKFGNSANYIGVQYGKPIPYIPDHSELYIIDFSYPKDILRDLNNRMKKLVVLDHHKTAEEDLRGEPYAIFDMNRSGAVMAWEYFHPSIPVPTLLQMIQDRDLWTWKLPSTKPVLEALRVYGDGYTSEDPSVWDKYLEPDDEMIDFGNKLLSYQDSMIESAVNKEKLKLVIVNGNLRTYITNTTVFVSEIGNKIYDGTYCDFSTSYFIDVNGIVNLSFRSKKDCGFDVGNLARKLGGGGHQSSSGAKISLNVLEDILKTGTWTI
jgi:oligoribonuclease NrnB/cAMP/cGMP phosphodiesterase (DHH superfamily)